MPPWSLGWHVERYRASRQISEIEEAAGQDPWNEQIQNMDKAWVSGVQFGKKNIVVWLVFPSSASKSVVTKWENPAGWQEDLQPWRFLAGKIINWWICSLPGCRRACVYRRTRTITITIQQRMCSMCSLSPVYCWRFFLSRCFCLPAFVFRISISCFSFDVLLWLDAFLVAMFLPFWLLLGFGLLQMTSISMNMGPWTGSCTPVNYCKSLLQDRAPNS